MCLLYAARGSGYAAMLSMGLVWLAGLNGRIGCGTAVVAAGMEARCMRERVIAPGQGVFRCGGFGSKICNASSKAIYVLLECVGLFVCSVLLIFFWVFAWW